jgi:UDP-N-acetyl-D-mannosaminuronic acid transferase (WecB/TagA/CpsF family)
VRLMTPSQKQSTRFEICRYAGCRTAGLWALERELLHKSLYSTSLLYPTNCSTMATEMKRVLIYGGKTGWIGGLMADLVKKEEGIECFLSEVRIENREDVAKELDEIKPTHVLMSAGITGRPNIDW